MATRARALIHSLCVDDVARGSSVTPRLVIIATRASFICIQMLEASNNIVYLLQIETLRRNYNNQLYLQYQY